MTEIQPRLAQAVIRNRGFTIVELMVVVATLGALMLIGFPGYQAYQVRAVRAGAQAVLLDVQSRQEQFAATNRAYAVTATVNDLSALNITIPQKILGNYDFTVAASCLNLVAASGTCTTTCSVPVGTGACSCPCTCTTGCPRSITGYTATATPTASGSQVADATLSINQYGLRMPIGMW